MTLTIELTDEQTQRLQERSRRLKVSTQELAVAAIRELLSERDDKFKELLADVLDENKELYNRLA